MSILRPALTLPKYLTRAEADDALRLGDITAKAFKNDPFNKWLFGSETQMRHTFTALAKHVYGPHGICHTYGQTGATMWCEPGVSKDLPALAVPGLLFKILVSGGGRALPNILAVDKGMAQHKPSKPFVYLFSIGVLQSEQGKGIGRQMMSPVLEACDISGQAVYLESSNPDNHGFYASLGFKRLELFSPVAGSPPLEAMWRDPINT